jgi:hypothetical protein
MLQNERLESGWWLVGRCKPGLRGRKSIIVFQDSLRPHFNFAKLAKPEGKSTLPNINIIPLQLEVALLETPFDILVHCNVIESMATSNKFRRQLM